MKIPSLLVIDDFYFAPKALAMAAQTLEFTTKQHDGHDYNGIGTGFVPENIEGLIGIHMARRVKLGINYFRLGTSKEKATTHIHSDNAIDPMASVLYLNEAPAGVRAGTAFWRHKKYGIEAMPTEQWIHQSVTADTKAFVEEINADGNDESKWDLVSLVGQKFNRFVTYPSHIFHSRYPQEAWGEGKADGRMIWTGFYNFAN
jgi:hypothetical protein